MASFKKTPSKKLDVSADATLAKSSSRSLRAHIKRIKSAKLATEEIFGEIKMDAARASIEILWETLFDYLCSAKDIDSCELGTLSSVVQRLASSRVQVVNFTTKSLENSKQHSSETLSDETVEKIEQALKLL